MTRLPVWRISGESFRLVLGHAPTFFRLGFPAFVLLLVLAPFLFVGWVIYSVVRAVAGGCSSTL